jgi:hypothetical protein
VSYRNLSNMIATLMEEGFQTWGSGDSFTYDVIPALMPVQPGANTSEPVAIMITMLPGAVLGTSFHTQAMLYNPSLVDPQVVIDKVKEMCEGLRALRTEVLRQVHALPGDLNPNGQVDLRSLPPLPPGS